MSEVAICDQKGKVLERRDIPVPGLRMALIKQAVIRQEANRRTGTAATKVRTQVAGSRRKPWRQKGTGRARVGDRRSPIWRGGGVIFGPHPRDHSQKLPKKARRRALHDALLGKVRDSEVVAIDEFPLDVPKTRVMATLLTEIGVDGSCLIAMGPISEPPKGFDSAKAVLTAVVRMTRNLPGVTTTRIEDLNVGDVLRHRHLLVTRAGLEFLFPAKPVKAKPGKEE